MYLRRCQGCGGPNSDQHRLVCFACRQRGIKPRAAKPKPRISDNTLDGLRVRDIRGITAGLTEFMGIDRGVGRHGWGRKAASQPAGRSRIDIPLGARRSCLTCGFLRAH